MVSAPLAQFPSKLPCLLRVLHKCRAVTRNEVENPIPPRLTLAAIFAKRGGEKGEKKKGGGKKLRG